MKSPAADVANLWERLVLLMSGGTLFYGVMCVEVGRRGRTVGSYILVYWFIPSLTRWASTAPCLIQYLLLISKLPSIAPSVYTTVQWLVFFYYCEWICVVLTEATLYFTPSIYLICVVADMSWNECLFPFSRLWKTKIFAEILNIFAKTHVGGGIASWQRISNYFVFYNYLL
jgi:hypothetical protein